MPNQSLLGSVLGSKCPRCREGKMFPFGMYHLTKLATMHKNCEKCGLRFEVEPGFFFGAMFMSYVLAVGEIVALFLSMKILLEKPSVTLLLAVIISALVVLTPFNFRYSRVLMLYLFGGVKYDKK